MVSSSASGRVPVAELASNATVFSEYDPSISVSVVGEGESALVLSTFRAAESTVHSPPKLEIRGSSSVAGFIRASMCYHCDICTFAFVDIYSDIRITIYRTYQICSEIGIMAFRWLLSGFSWSSFNCG